MKRLLLLVLLLFPTPAYALNCIALILYDPTDKFPTLDRYDAKVRGDLDLAVVSVRWSQLERLRQFDQVKVAAWKVFYDSFGTQQGPNLYSHWNELGMSYDPGTGRGQESLEMAYLERSPVLGWRDKWIAAADEFSGVREEYVSYTDTRQAEAVVVANSIFMLGELDSQVVTSANNLPEDVGLCQ